MIYYTKKMSSAPNEKSEIFTYALRMRQTERTWKFLS